MNFSLPPTAFHIFLIKTRNISRRQKAYQRGAGGLAGVIMLGRWDSILAEHHQVLREQQRICISKRILPTFGVGNGVLLWLCCRNSAPPFEEKKKRGSELHTSAYPRQFLCL